MVATDIASRGLDVETISHVINYDIPGSADDYIHRVGRTGRAERNGDAITLVTPEDRSAVRDIERALGERISVRNIEGFDTGATGADCAHSGRTCHGIHGPPPRGFVRWRRAQTPGEPQRLGRALTTNSVACPPKTGPYASHQRIAPGPV
jgi:superfamily II DNA/RNA helicase